MLSGRSSLRISHVKISCPGRSQISQTSWDVLSDSNELENLFEREGNGCEDAVELVEARDEVEEGEELVSSGSPVFDDFF